MNKTEAEYEALFLGKFIHGYEEITLRLGDDCRYTPDFWVLGDDDVLEFHEVKGGFIRDDAKAKLRVAAEKYPHFRFKLAQKKAGAWSRVMVGPLEVAA
jgi:hypothetical protein